MGTPDFSVPPLKRLSAREDFEILLAVTQPDRPKGRGKKLIPSPVKSEALRLGIEIFQPENINSDHAIEKLASLKPDFFVVAAFGQILSRKVLDIPAVCPINIHASLLPKYRGASPIQAAVLNMEKESGITTMIMSKELDAGDILLQSSTPITEKDTAKDLHDRLSSIGGDLIVETIAGLLENNIAPQPQDASKASFTKLLKKNDGLIDWNLPAENISAHIRAMTPWPSAFTRFEGKTIKIFKAAAFSNLPPGVESCECYETEDNSCESAALADPDEYGPGTVVSCCGQGIFVKTGKGYLCIEELMGFSGKKLSSAQFLCGHHMDAPSAFEP